MSYSIQKASEHELSEIYHYADESRKEATNVDSPNDEYYSNKPQPKDFHPYYLCLKDGNILIGWIQMDTTYDMLTDELLGWINELYVKKEFRRKGYSKLLMKKALEEFKSNGFQHVGLNVYYHNKAATRLYKGLGFKDVSKLMKITI